MIAPIIVMRRCKGLRVIGDSSEKSEYVLVDRTGSRRAGFSMAEMLVAVVILGLGLLMAGAMFPIGWTQARDIGEYTAHVSTSNAAETTIRMLCKVGSPASPVTSFRGDDPDPTAHAPDVWGDTYVHPLHIENALVDQSSSDALGRVGEFLYADGSDASVESMGGGIYTRTPLPAVQVPFGDRVFPPMPPLPSTRPEIEHWYDQLTARRFAWAMFHKLDAPPAGVSQTGYEPRSMTVYLVTLRRPQATHRYARQEPRLFAGADPSIFPRSLPESDDVLFPVPWLVTLTVRGNWDETGFALPRTGVPSEILANVVSPSPLRRLGAQMLTVGTVLIDRHNGNVYTAKQHRFVGSGNEYDNAAAITLDREINVEDIGVAPGVAVVPQVDDRRDFWVFPPPVEPNRVSSRFPVFTAHQPVVSIETRHMTFSPQ